MAQKAIVLTDEQIEEVEKLAADGATTEEIAGELGISERTFFEIKNRQPAVEAAYKKGKYKAKKIVRKRLWDFINSGNHDNVTLTATMFYLKTQDGWREKQDINHTSEDGTMSPPKQLTVNFVDVSKSGE